MRALVLAAALVVAAQPAVGQSFSARLGAKNGVGMRTYLFRKTKLSKTSGGSYSELMIAECKKFSMKPVCDHPSYCAKDPTALYIGQDHHIG